MRDQLAAHDRARHGTHARLRSQRRRRARSGCRRPSRGRWPAPTQAVSTPTDLERLRNSKTIVQLVDSTDYVIGLPTATPPDVASRRQSLLDARRRRHRHRVDVRRPEPAVPSDGRPRSTTLYSTALTDGEVDSAVAALHAEFDGIAASIVPPHADSFTLSGRRTSVPMRFDNNSDEILQVMITLDSGADKLQFPENNQVVTLAPGAQRDRGTDRRPRQRQRQRQPQPAHAAG